jgi:trans-aconitate methyltransferase
MSGFTADWLALREPADQASRSAEVTAYVASALGSSRDGVCLDLGAGTGSNLRYLSRSLPANQRWRLIDDDPHLLARANGRGGVAVERQVVDLRRIAASMFDGVALVTASALLDLVSERWLQLLVSHAADARSAVLFALNYDGRIICSPPDDADDHVRDLVNAHQRTDKGFGPALGPAAGERVEQLLGSAGYVLRVASSDWVLRRDQEPLQRELLRGWASAAAEVAPGEREPVQAWFGRRMDLLSAGRSEIVVGHVDVGGVTSR